LPHSDVNALSLPDVYHIDTTFNPADHLDETKSQFKGFD